MKWESNNMREEYHKWHSNDLDREFEMLIFGHYGYPIVLFPTFNAHYWEAKDYGLINSASHLIDSGQIKIYCPEGVDYLSWDNNLIEPAEKVLTQMAYETAILSDVIAFIRHETSLERVGVAGCNFGAYQALNLAFRHPDLIEKLVCIGGFFDIKPFINNYYDDNCYFNNPPDYLPNLTDNWYIDKFKTMKIILGTGESDQYSEQNKNISEILRSKNVNHWLDIRPNTGHNWEFWREVFPKYLAQI
ncbi:MAG: alpha/beta hydrolase-fold protein [Ignavibacteriaceae bacterium]|jgi:esterase/lipase superfamily enzyme